MVPHNAKCRVCGSSFSICHGGANNCASCEKMYDPSNFKVTQAEKSTIWIQFEINRPVAAVKSLRFALFFLCHPSNCKGMQAKKIDDLNPIWVRCTRLVAAIKSLRFALFIHWHKRIQISNNDHIHTLLPRKELPWRHNQTHAQQEAQRRVVSVFGIWSFVDYTSKNMDANFYWNRCAFSQCPQLSQHLHRKMTCLSGTRDEPAETPLALANLAQDFSQSSWLNAKF